MKIIIYIIMDTCKMQNDLGETLLITTSIRVDTLCLKHLVFVSILRHPCISKTVVRQLYFTMFTVK